MAGFGRSCVHWKNIRYPRSHESVLSMPRERTRNEWKMERISNILPAGHTSASVFTCCMCVNCTFDSCTTQRTHSEVNLCRLLTGPNILYIRRVYVRELAKWPGNIEDREKNGTIINVRCTEFMTATAYIECWLKSTT